MGSNTLCVTRCSGVCPPTEHANATVRIGNPRGSITASVGVWAWSDVMGKLLGVTCLTACAEEVSTSAVRNDSHELEVCASLNREQARSRE